MKQKGAISTKAVEVASNNCRLHEKKKQKNNDGDIRGQQQKDQMELQEHETI